MAQILESLGQFRRAANVLAIKELKPLGLGTKQAGALSYLARHKESSHADLARHTVTDPAAMGRIVDALVKRKLLIQKEHPTDRRRWMISLSPEGRALAKKTEAVFEHFESMIVHVLTGSERDRLVEILKKITETLATKGNLS